MAKGDVLKRVARAVGRGAAKVVNKANKAKARVARISTGKKVAAGVVGGAVAGGMAEAKLQAYRKKVGR